MRVLWLGLGGETIFLSNLKDIIDEELEPFGFLKEQRKYSPNITIAQDIIAKDNIEKFHKIFLKKEFNSISVNVFHLVLSEYTFKLK
jgi:2'-5' RNA ligase